MLADLKHSCHTAMTVKPCSRNNHRT